MRGDEVRTARIRNGWTQAELAQRLGVSQAYVSLLERGRGGSARLFAKIAGLMDVGQGERRLNDQVPPYDWDGPLNTVPVPTSLRLWHRPRWSGDWAWTSTLGEGALVVGALDVAGHGVAMFPKAAYARGLIDGALRDLESAPRMDVLRTIVANGLRRADVDAAWFLAILRFSSDATAGRPVLYESISNGYPPPLLLSGPPFQSLLSVATGEAPGTSVYSVIIGAPFRLVVASDGLLRRLGAGDEPDGRRSLLTWQTGPQRDHDPDDHLKVASPVSDDESLLIVDCPGWDQEYKFQVADSDARHRAKRDVVDRVRTVLGSAATSQVLTPLGEALSNVQYHAYGGGDGPVLVRLKLAKPRAWVEVEDHGLGGHIAPGEGVSLIKKLASHVDIRRHYPSGTVVTICI